MCVCSWRYVDKNYRLNILYWFISYSECSLKCGRDSQCLETKIPGLPEVCACSDGTYTNFTCPQMEQNNVTSINIHGLNSMKTFA